MPAIELIGVSKRFVLRKDRPRSFQDLFLRFAGRKPAATSAKPFWAVRDITFTVRRGEAVGVIGENGSGKSTLLKLLAHIVEPTSGHIVTHGRVSALLELGAGFHPDLTGRENIYLNGSILGMSRAEIDRRFDEIVDFAELEQFIDMPVKHYSSGMYVRLGFAVATSVQPEILLIDEILAVGDVAFQAKCLDRIRDMRKQGTTIFFVSHDLESVAKLCDKAIWMDHGQARASGPTDEVIEQYKGQMTAVQETQLAQRQQVVERELAEVPAAGMDAEPTLSPSGDGPAIPRWGTREVEIYAVRLIDGHGTERRIFETGKPLTVRLFYRARNRIEQPVFGLAVHRSDGLALTGPNTLTSNYPIEAVQGSGYVDCRIDTLPLLEGSYELSVSVYDHELRHAYDHQYRLHSFRVQSKSIHEVLGFLYVPCTWHLGKGNLALPSEPGAVGQLARPVAVKRDA